MTKYLKFIFLLIVLFSQGIYAQTADIIQGCAPLTVSFAAPVTSTTYFWNFKDGVTSSLQNPQNVFTKGGIYNVSFQESVNGPVIKTLKIEVFAEPVATIKVASGCYPLNAQLTSSLVVDPKITIENYTWVFGDGSSTSGATTSNTSHVYHTTGDYNISLSLLTQFPSCNTTTIYSNAVHVYNAPVTSFTTTPANTISCNTTLKVGFSNTSTGSLPLSYSWDLGNGQTSTSLNPPAQTYTSNAYTATLTTKFTANLAGCQSSASKAISVGRPIPVIKQFRDTICIYDTASFKSTSAGVKLWTADANSIIKVSSKTSNTTDSMVVYFTKGGLHTVTLKVTSPDGQCSDQITAQIYVDDVQASIQHSPVYSCTSPLTVQYKGVANQTNVDYKWTFNDGKTATGISTSKTYKSTSKDVYYGLNTLEQLSTMLVVTSKTTGCSYKAYSTDTMWLPNARMMPNLSKGCAPLTVVFSDSSTSKEPIVKWQWVFGDGTPNQNNTTSQSVTHTYTQPGIYSAKVIINNSRGCLDTSYAIEIQVGSVISNLDFTASKTDVCPGESVLFTPVVPAGSPAIQAYHFTTEGNRSFQCPQNQNLTWAYNYLTGLQDVSLTVDYNGCFTTIKKTAFVNVKGTIASIDYNAPCTDPLKYNFTDKNKNATSILWNFGDGQTSATTDQTHRYTSSGDYKVVLTTTDAASGCAATKDSVFIKVRSLKANVKMDTLLCLHGTYIFDAGNSVDVDAQCYKGYNWQIPNSDVRQVTTSNTITSFKFDKPGAYTTQLIVTDINNCKDTLTQKIKVFDIATKFTADDVLICNPQTVNFKDQSVGDTTIVGWNWSFGDGSVAILQNPAHTYTIPASSIDGTYKVLVIFKDIVGCSKRDSLYIKQYKPTSNIAASKSLLCLGDSVKFTASDYKDGGSTLKYNWDFGNGMTATSQSKSILYDTDKTYTINLNYEEVSSGCKGTTSTTVNLQTYPVAGFKSDADTMQPLCAPQLVHFTDTSKSKYPITNYWNFKNGEMSSLGAALTVFPKGDYKVQHIVTTNNGCADTTYKEYKVYRPEGSFVVDRNTICKDASITFTSKNFVDVTSYSWAFGDGIVVSNQPVVTHAYTFHPPNGQTKAKLILTGNFGTGSCSYSPDTSIFIYQVISDFTRLDGIDSSTCFNDGSYKLTNTSTGATSYKWDFGDGQTSSAQNVTAHVYSSPGTYSVKLAVKSDDLGCVDTTSKQIVLFKNPIIQAVGDTACQYAGVATLKVTNPVATDTYKWSPNIGLSSTTATTITTTIQHTVTYSVIETDTNGCTDKTNVTALIVEPLKLRNLDTSIVIGDIISLPVSAPSYYHFKWNPEKGLSCLACNYPTVQPLQDIVYNLQVTDIGMKNVPSCYTSDYTYKIAIKPETFVKLPSMFTPNGDGNNDVVKVNGWGIKELREFQIFNRWGQLIYSSSNITEGWDGTYNGMLQSSDIYVYKVTALTWREQEIKEEGYINLVR